MKKLWLSPNIEIENFTPNEYCASSCTEIACSRSRTWYHWRYHSPDHCGNAHNQVIREPENGEIYIIEINAGWSGSSTRERSLVYTDSNYNTKATVLTPGMTVYWQNHDSLNYEYDHYGIVQNVDTSHPNHS